MDNVLSGQLNVFDDIDKHFDEIEVYSAIVSLPDSIQSSCDYKAELMAFSLVEIYSNSSFDFKPLFADATIRNGYAPNKEMVLYWENRISDVINPILKSRYLGLVYFFSEQICGKKPDFSSIVIPYISSLIDIVDGDFMPNPIPSINKIEISIFVSLLYNLKNCVCKAKKTLSDFIARHYDISKIGIWGVPYQLHRDLKNLYDKDEVEQLVLDLETKRLELNGNYEANPWLLLDVTRILSELYHECKRDDKIEDILVDSERVFLSNSLKLTNIQRLGNLKIIYELYHKYNCKKTANNLLNIIYDMGKSIKDEMQFIEMDSNIKKSDLDKQSKYILDREIDEAYSTFTLFYVPDKDKSKDVFMDMHTKYPLLFEIPTNLIDSKGRITRIVKSVDQDIESHVIMHISDVLMVDSIWLHDTIQYGISKKVFTIDNILSFLKKTPSINIDRYSIIEKGLVAYFNNDFITSIHLLIPQIEEAVRNIMEIIGGHILKPQIIDGVNISGFPVRILDDMLHDENLCNVLTENFALYLRILLTDNRGWNLRNNVFHGLATDKSFNPMTADRIFHALLCLGIFRDKRQQL